MIASKGNHSNPVSVQDRCKCFTSPVLQRHEAHKLINHKNMRKRINLAAVASSEDYVSSKRRHREWLEEKLKINEWYHTPFCKLVQHSRAVGQMYAKAVMEDEPQLEYLLNDMIQEIGLAKAEMDAMAGPEPYDDYDVEESDYEDYLADVAQHYFESINYL